MKLDDFFLKPIGVYGSREEIVRLLRELGTVDAEMCGFPTIDRRKLTSNA